MIKHILLYKFKPTVDRIDEHLLSIENFRNKTDGLIELHCGRHLNQNGKYSHGFTMTFDSHESLDKYNRSATHEELVNQFKNDIEDKLIFDMQI